MEPTVPPDLSIKKIALTASVARGATARLSIRTAGKADCSITVTYNSGPSQASGLVNKIADSSGRIMWSWKVGTRTARGSYPIDISCTKGEQTGWLSLTFRVT